MAGEVLMVEAELHGVIDALQELGYRVLDEPDLIDVTQRLQAVGAKVSYQQVEAVLGGLGRTNGS